MAQQPRSVDHSALLLQFYVLLETIPRQSQCCFSPNPLKQHFIFTALQQLLLNAYFLTKATGNGNSNISRNFLRSCSPLSARSTCVNMTMSRKKGRGQRTQKMSRANQPPPMAAALPSISQQSVPTLSFPHFPLGLVEDLVERGGGRISAMLLLSSS